MQSFTDTAGKRWTLNLTIGIAKKIKRTLNVDLLEDEPGLLVQILLDSPLTRIEILWLMVDSDVDQSEFDDALGAGCLKEAMSAFWAAVENFIHQLNPSRATAISQFIGKIQELQKSQTQMIIDLATGPEATDVMNRSLEQAKKKAKLELGKVCIEAEDSSGS